MAVHEFKAADGRIVTRQFRGSVPDSIRHHGKVYRRVFYAPTVSVDRSDSMQQICLPYNYKYAKDTPGVHLDKRGRVYCASDRAKKELVRRANDGGDAIVRSQNA